MIDFLTGFIFCWVLLGAFTVGGLRRDWHEHEGFWVVLTLPMLPLCWAIYFIASLIQGREE